MANGVLPPDKFLSPHGEWRFAILIKLIRQMANGDSPQDKFHSPEGEWLFAILTKLFRQMANGDSPWQIKGFASFEKRTWPLSLISSHILY